MTRSIPWAVDEIETLRALDAEGVGVKRICSLLERPHGSVKSKLSEIRGKPYGRGRLHRPDSPPAYAPSKFQATFEIPKPRKTDHLLHCLSVLRANKGCGFPVGGCK